MKEISRLIRECRQNAGFTQEYAAEKLPASLRSIQSYELGERSCPLDLIPCMADAYDDPMLNIRVLQRLDPWKAIMPEVPEVSLAEAAAGALEAMDKLTREHMRTILHIVRDGMVDEAEREAWSHVMNTVTEALAWLTALAAYKGCDE